MLDDQNQVDTEQEPTQAPPPPADDDEENAEADTGNTESGLYDESGSGGQ